jgi:hypothetical protein
MLLTYIFYNEIVVILTEFVEQMYFFYDASDV